MLRCTSCRRNFPVSVTETSQEGTAVTSISAPPRQERATPGRTRTKSASSIPATALPAQENTARSAAFTTLPGGPEPLAQEPERTVITSSPELPGEPADPSQPADAPPALAQERTVMVRLPTSPPTAARPFDEEQTYQGAPPIVLEEEEVTPPVPKARKTPPPRAQGTSRPRGVASATTGSRRALAPATPAPVPAPLPAAPEMEADSQPHDTLSLEEGMRLGGYQLRRKLGAGGMGTVWLARQLSLDRDVALKVLRPSLARDPQFVYRFTQEAFAAAQLVHHNIAQIYDCGSDKQIHFFSMEYVDAESLQALVAREGRLDPEVAAGYILQAARGLQFAHDQGMVHRDIKPDNLLLNRNSIVKVADLGLVQRSRVLPAQKASPEELVQSLTGAEPAPRESAMGTPAYIAPEQVENSSRVDGRADMYSLGCTFYHLLTGRPPFEAESVLGLLSMHLFEKPLPPDERVRRVPKALSDIVMRMLAKQPEERFQRMEELVRTLEAFLGIEGAASFSPREEHANLLERCVEEFNAAAWGRRRRWLVAGAALLGALATGLAGWRLGPLQAVAAGAFCAATWMASFIVRGLLQKGSLFLHFRQFVFQTPLVTWGVWLLLLGGAGYGLFRFGWLVPAGCVLGGGLVAALGFYALVDRQVAAERQPLVEEVEQMLRSMRLRGLEEGALRQFVCKYSGDVWESFYEALFGFEAKLLAREKWGRNDRGLPRHKHATWRELLIRWMNALQRARQRRRERRQLRRLESENTKAQEQDSSSA